MSPLVFALPGNGELCARLALALRAQTGALAQRRFPDGESYVRLDTPVAGRDVIFVCTLHAPDEKTLALLFAAGAARELGAASIGLAAPYLAYMRQDKRFRAGEAVSSVHFGALISAAFDWLVTVDPHLHRRGSLAEIYSIRTRVAHAAPLVSAWIRQNVGTPLIVGPDRESEQWAAAVAGEAGAPHVALAKTRRGDLEVEISLPDLAPWRGRTPVLVDDIISSGRTMAQAVRKLLDAGFPAPYCVGVHGVFAGDALEQLLAAGARGVVTTDSIPHPTNAIGVGELLAAAVEAIRPAFDPGQSIEKRRR